MRCVFWCVLVLMILMGEIGMGGGISEVLKTLSKNRTDFSLDNGLRVVILNVSDARSVNILLGFEAGSLYESKPGLAYLTSQVLLFKNRRYGMLEIPNHVESLGGSIDTSSGHDIATIGIKCLYEDIYTSLSKLFDVLTGFEVDGEVLNIVRPNIISALKVKEDDPWEYTRRVFLKELYGDHPYGREPEGEESGISAIQPEDVEKFFRDFYTPDNAVLVIVGRVEKRKLVEFIKRKYSGWKGKRAEVSLPEVTNVSKSREVRISKKLKQATIRVGHLSTNIKDRNRVELKVLNFILGGGGFGSRLMEKIREREGLAYGVFSNFYIDRKLNGYFFVGTQTEGRNISRVVEIITNEILSLVRDGITEKELEEAKGFSEGSILLGMESFSTIASFLLYEKLFGLKENYFIKDVERISVIKREDIERVAREYLRPTELATVIVGGE
ncbi:MAG: pitrilysin family protein [Brevinematia bacterium]